MGIKSGDRVLFVNDTGRGKVIEVLAGGKLRVEDENGFDYVVAENEVMKEVGNLREVVNRLDDFDVMQAAGKDQPKKSRMVQAVETADPYIRHSADTLEVDLHIEKLVDHPKRLTNGEIVEKQLQVFERMLQKAISERKRKAIFIHGVGQGVLRAEIRNLLQFYPNVVVQDASYKTYGYGATEVLIRQKS